MYSEIIIKKTQRDILIKPLSLLPCLDIKYLINKWLRIHTIYLSGKGGIF